MGVYDLALVGNVLYKEMRITFYSYSKYFIGSTVLPAPDR